jgi:hypothetical protein
MFEKPAGLPIPSGVQQLHDRLAADTAEIGVHAEVTARHVDGKRWRVQASSDRVTMRIDVDGLSRGRLTQKTSRLLIDGVESQRASGYEDLMRIYLDPDRADGAIDWPSAEVPLEDSPAEVQLMAHKVIDSPQLRALGLVPTVERAGPMWALTLEAGKVRLQWTFAGSLNWLRPEDDPQVSPRGLNMWIDGVDYSEQIQGSLERALAKAAQHLSTPKSPAIASESAAAVNTGVQVRRTTVIRV